MKWKSSSSVGILLEFHNVRAHLINMLSLYLRGEWPFLSCLDKFNVLDVKGLWYKKRDTHLSARVLYSEDPSPVPELSFLPIPLRGVQPLCGVGRKESSGTGLGGPWKQETLLARQYTNKSTS